MMSQGTMRSVVLLVVAALVVGTFAVAFAGLGGSQDTGPVDVNGDGYDDRDGSLIIGDPQDPAQQPAQQPTPDFEIGG